jgi:transglutaminase-like putative cysteine protease
MSGTRRSLRAILTGVLGMSMAVALSAGAADQDTARTFSFTYEVEIPAQPAGTGSVDVFIPLAVTDAHQAILRRDVKPSIPGRETIESRYGNTFWHGHVDHSDGKPIIVVVDYIIQRRVFQQQRLASSDFRKYSPSERKELALSLGPDLRVPISGPLIDRVRAELPQTDPSPLARARAIYDYVIENMEYKKVGTGWGNGDTFWACSARYGNCTDFHALFISLARAEDIPAQFEIGFPIPEDRTSGVIDGYHCWTEFHLPDVGWFPIDASEAWKHRERRDLYFGTQPADRIQFSIGRDLELGDGHTTGSLNYFIYPHVEVAGKRLDNVKRQFRFSEIPDADIAQKLALR